MKTTIEISDSLMSEVRSLAREQGTTLRAVIEESLRRELDERKSDRGRKTYRLPDRRRDGKTRPGVDLSDWRAIREIIYEPRHPSA